MPSFAIEPRIFMLGLRAAKTVAVVDGNFDQRERELVAAAMRALAPELVTQVDIDALETITGEELAAEVADELTRTRIIQVMLIMAMIDTEVDEREHALIKDFAKALDVDEPRLANLKQVLNEHHTLVKLDLNRSSRMVKDAVGWAYEKDGFGGVLKTIAPFISKKFAVDEALAWRYRKLGLLPENTFGRAYWTHMTERGFGFPGEPGGFPEVFIKHDCCHTLGGYDTDPIGECEVVSFISGFMEADPFWYLFMVCVHMHLGIETFDDNPLGFAAFDAERCMNAMARGMAVNTDLYVPGVDWWSLFPEPIDAVRARYNIAPA